MKIIFVSLLLLGMVQTSIAQTKTSKSEYVAKYHKMAVEEMHRSGVPASITLAQGILESGSGNSTLAVKANNHFGIKCHTTWSGKVFHMDDDTKDECFRVYRSAKESFKDHSEFLVTRSRYASLFKLDKYDYKGWATGLKKAGYATNPHYARLLISIIEDLNLSQYDKMDKTSIAHAVKHDKHVHDKSKPKHKNKTSKNSPVESVAPTAPGRVFILNRIKTIKAGKSETLLNIGVQHQVNVNRLKRYNDMKDGDPVIEGTNIFLQPKRKKGDLKYHKVSKGETMYEVSQMHGILLSSLYELNMMPENSQAYPGELLSLRKKRSYPPQIRSYEAVLIEKQEVKNIDMDRSETKIEQKKDGDQKDRTLEKKKEPTKPGLFSSEVPKKSEKDNKKELVPEVVTESKPAYVEKKYESAEIDKTVEVVKPPTEKMAPGRNSDIPSNAVESNSVYYYEVEAGNTLYSIGQWFKVSVDQLKAWNDLNSNEISIGQVLIVGK